MLMDKACDSLWCTSSTAIAVTLFPAGKGSGEVRTFTIERYTNKFCFTFQQTKKPIGTVRCPTVFFLRKSVATFAAQGVERKTFFVQFFGSLRVFLAKVS